MGFGLFLLQSIPIVGKVVDAFSAYAQKKQDVALEKYKEDGRINVEAMKTDVELLKAQHDVRLAHSGDPGVKIAMALFMIPSGIWYAMCMYDSTFRQLIPDYTWRVLDPPDAVWKILAVVVAYLFGVTLKSLFKK